MLEATINRKGLSRFAMEAPWRARYLAEVSRSTTQPREAAIDAWLDAVTMADADSMNRPNRPEQPSLVTKPYLDEKLGELETKLLTALARELDARFGQFTREMDARFAERDARFERFAKDMELRLARFENRVVWQILGTMAGTIVAMTAIFSAIVLIVGAD